MPVSRLVIGTSQTLPARHGMLGIDQARLSEVGSIEAAVVLETQLRQGHESGAAGTEASRTEGDRRSSCVVANQRDAFLQELQLG
jgi:hypothetical protein